MTNTKEQVEKYNSLEFGDTYRGQSVILLGILSGVIICLTFLTKETLILDLGFNIIILLLTLIPLSFEIYKGKIWAIIITQILLPLIVLREVSIYTVHTNFESIVGLVVGLLVYLIIMKSLVRSYQIEKTRKKS